jgi:hypothetical protein
MKYSLIPLEKENDLNKLLKRQKESNLDIHILFHSLWDEAAQTLVKKITERYKKTKGAPLYLVDSFNMPHSFVIFDTTKIPALVSLERGKTFVEDYLPRIYSKLKV